VSQPEVSIERGLPEELRHEAALVFDQGFGDKMGYGIPDDRRRLALIERALVADDIVVAKVGDELAGIVGLKTRGGRYAKGPLSDEALSLRSLYRHLGFVGALRAKFILVPFRSTPPADALYLGEIVVGEAARGRGVGTRLLDEVVTIARVEGKARIQLDVADSNHRARELYERQGYVVVKTIRFGFMRRFMGYGGVDTMDHVLDQPAAGDVA